MADERLYGNQVVGVYRDEETARRAAEAAREAAGVPADRVTVERSSNSEFALRAEMREEVDHAVAGPGPVGPYTKEMTKGVVKALLLWTPIGVVLALPFAFIEMFGLALPVRMLIAAIAGGVAGATVALSIAGGLSAKRPSDAMAAERGVSVGVRVDGPDDAKRAAEALSRFGPIRVDAGVSGQPTGLVAREPEDERARGGKILGD